MDRIINFKVVGNHITKDNDVAGVRGEANITKLRITFDEGWFGYTIKVYFWDAHGENPVVKTLSRVDLEDLNNNNVYLVPISGEPLAIAGEMTVSIEGSKGGVKQVSATCNLKVWDSPENRDVINSPPPTPTELEQLQQSFADLESEVSEYVGVSKKIDNLTVEGGAIEAGETVSVTKSINKDGGYRLIFGIPIGPRGEKGDTGDDGPQGPAGRDGKPPYIGENGNWFVWDVASEQYKDTKKKAQGPKGDTGDTGPQGIQGLRGVSGKDGTNGKDGLTPDIGSNGNWWLGNKDTGVKAQGKDGKSGKSPYIEENGNWFVWDVANEQYEDTGVKAQGEDGASGLPTVVVVDDSNGMECPLPAYTEIRYDVPVDYLVITDFEYNQENPNADMWAVTFTAGEHISAAFPTSVEWAVAEPVFTAGYTYYLSFIPFGEKILGVWVAKELTA